MEKTCIIIPCFNEGSRLELETFQLFLQTNQFTLIFVNDGSTDNTIDTLKKLKIKFFDLVHIINLPQNVGKGEAVRQGFLAAFDVGGYDYLGYLDADLATPLEEIEYLLGHFNGHTKIVLGARVLRLGAIIERDPLRHYLGRIFATLASNVLDMKVYDSQCGAKLFEEKMAQVLFREPFISKWLFDLELLYRLKLIDPDSFFNNTLEVPLRTWKEKGNTKIKITDFLSAPFDLFKIKQNTHLKIAE